MNIKKLVLFLLLLVPILNHAQSGNWDIGVEFQAYPTGFIPGIHIEKGLNDKNALFARIGYNVVRHRDLGEHEDERGGGFGFSLGYRNYFKPSRRRFLWGIRSDLWFNEVDWKDNIGLPNEVNGTTQVTVLQPTAEFGFASVFDNNIVLTPSIALGAEINVKTEGASVGQGAIVLIGFTLALRK